jgi:uncharacterized protein (TIGR02444 family)
MTETETKTETPFWQFSLHYYRQAGVSDACIALQDACGADVNLFLFLMWLAAGRQLLSEAEVKKLDDLVGSWRTLTIIPIRDTRRKLKGAATLVEPGKQEAFRTKVKAVELEAERLQQEALYAFTKAGPLGSEAAPPAAARANVAAYENVLGRRFPKASLDLLFSAFDRIEHATFAGR